ncbi:MAG: Ldh family oxidoreductase [Verrucomicrobiae bacterium]|nr:Ldh family oxidoreductase [Verrucomicrobiae bacterium]
MSAGNAHWVVPQAAHDALVTAAFAARGFEPDEVAAMVKVCGEAARHGIRTHNAIKALHLDDLFGSRVGGCVPGAAVEVLPVRFPAARVWNAHRKLGPGVAYAAMDTCVAIAREQGVGMVSVDEAWHYLWGGAYVLEAARQGFIGYTNCTAMLAEVVPFGGRRPALGTNPHSWAFPTRTSIGFPVLIDFATSSAAMGRVQQLGREGRPLPSGWAVDADGNETRDPARASALLPFGGHKGYGLGLVDELFAAFIGGGRPTVRGRFPSSDASKRTPSFHFMAIHPEAVSGGRWEAGLDRDANVKAVVSDILGPGNEGALLPGQLEHEAAQRCARAGGLLFTDSEMDAFDAIASACGQPAWDRSALARAD